MTNRAPAPAATRFLICMLTCCASVLLVPHRASAKNLFIGALGGYTSSTGDKHGIEPYGVGVGASAGVTLPMMPIYLGARFLYDFGDSTNVSSLHLKANYVQYGIDLGYDLNLLDLVVLRPQLGIGRAAISVSSSGGSGVAFKLPAQGSSLYLAPGVGLIIPVGLIYVGAELRYNLLTEKAGKDSVSMLASIGLTI